MSDTIFAPDVARLQLELDEARALLEVWQRAWAAAADAIAARRDHEGVTTTALADLLDSVGVINHLDDGILEITVSEAAFTAALLAGRDL